MITLREFLSACESVTGRRFKQSGNQHNGSCPAHQNSSTQFSVTEENGKILFTCFSQKCSLDQVLGSIGISKEEFFGTDNKKEYKIIAEYPYIDENGIELYRVTRSNYHKALPNRLSADGKHRIWSLNGGIHYLDQRGDYRLVRNDGKEKGRPTKEIPAVSKRVLFNLPKLLKSPQATVVWVDGEKDSIRGESVINDPNIVFISNSGGCKAYRDEYADALAGRKVVLIPDEDEASHQAVQRNIGKLKGKVASVRILELPGLSHKEDLSDYLDRNSAEDFLNLFYGIRLPHKLEYEKVCIGSIFKNNSLMYSIIEANSIPTFFDAGHRNILTAMVSCINKRLRIDTLTVAEELGIQSLLNVGGRGYLEELEILGTADQSINDLLSEIQNKWEIRELMRIADSVYYDGPSAPNAKTLKDRIGIQLAKAIPQRYESQSIKDVCQGYLENADNNNVIPTGFYDYDTEFKGLPKKSLILLAGRPSMGKSTLGVNIATNAAKANHNVLILSIEMSAEEELAPKVLASEALVALSDIRDKNLSAEEVERIVSAQNGLPDTLRIDDSPSLTLEQIRSKIVNHEMKFGKLDMVVIDYIQRIKMGKTSGKRHEDLEEIANTLKQYAKEFDIAMVVLSQLSRELEKRNPPRPVLSDLKASGGLEEAADVVWLLYREEYYEPQSNAKGITEINMAKGRSLGTGIFNLAFIGHYSKFMNLVKI